ncbi:redoxin domain-containing protein [Aquimarina sp. M1]
MKQFKNILVVLFLSSFLFSCNQEDEKAIIAKVDTALNELDSIEYDITIQAFANQKEKFKDRSSWHFDFTKGDDVQDIKFYAFSKEGEYIFNGDSTFIAQPKIETIMLRGAEETCVPLQLSLYPYKKLLSKIIDDPDISIYKEEDTVINSIDYYTIQLNFKEKEIGDDCQINKVEGKQAFYKLIIDKKTYVPKQIILPKFKEETTYLTFDNFRKVDQKSEAFWDGKELPKEYIRMDSKTFGERRLKQLNSYVGKKMASWELPELKTQNKVNPAQLKGEIVLLDFWFPNCPPCVESQPVLNEIYAKYKNKGLKLYAAEFTNEKREDLINYVEKQKITYPILYNAKVIASTYKITAAPTVIIINKNGIVIYAKPGFNKEEITKLIEENL